MRNFIGISICISMALAFCGVGILENYESYVPQKGTLTEYSIVIGLYMFYSLAGAVILYKDKSYD